MKKNFIRIFVLVFLAGWLSPMPSQANGFNKVSITTVWADGSAASGQMFKSKFEGVFHTTDSRGEVTLEVPTGSNSFEGVLYPSLTATNLGLGNLNFNFVVTANATIVVTLPEVLETSLKLQDSAGKSVTHAPIEFGFSCSTQTSLKIDGLTEQVTLYHSAPRMVSRIVDEDWFWSSYSNSGLRAENGIAEISIFKPQWPNVCNKSANGSSIIPDYKYKPASYLDYVSIPGQVLLSGDAVITLPEAPQFQISKPISLTDSLGDMRGSLFGTVSSSHPSILAKHLTLINTVGGFGGVQSPQPDGKFELRLGFDKSKVGKVPYFSIKTGLAYQSERIPTPPVYQLSWSGSTLKVEALGLQQSMGDTSLTTNGKIYKLRTNPDAGSAEVKIANVSPFKSVLINNSIYSVNVVLPDYFASCDDVWKVFTGGISKSASAKNKGAKLSLKPTVWGSYFSRVARLDKDKDGIACEK